MIGTGLMLLVFGVVLLLLIRAARVLWRVISSPEGTRRFWNERRGLLIGLAVVILVLGIATMAVMSHFLGRQVAGARFAFDYLTAKHGLMDLSLTSSSSFPAPVPGSEVYEYSIGTNSGFLTVGRMTNRHGDVSYVIVSDEPKK